MLTAFELCRELHIGREVLERWVAAGWLSPLMEEGVARYRDIDIARAGLILALAEEFELNDQAIDIVIDLIDQVHGLRLALRHLLDTR